MEKRVIVHKGVYYDSVKLMLVTNEMNALEGILETAVVMGTDLNKETLERTGLMTPEAEAAAPTDMIVAFAADSQAAIDAALKKLEESLSARSAAEQSGAYRPKSLDTAVKMQPGSNLCIISVPGKYAKDTAMEALRKNLHVMLFSDNVSLAEELELKQYAAKKELFVMGPDCGTAMIQTVPLCFSNKVNQGDVGIVAASGTGAQEVMVLVSAHGAGLSQVIGTGGRDLSVEINGLMVLQSLAALNEDTATKVIVLISKPPAPSVADRVIALIKEKVTKPVVINFLGQSFAQETDGNIHFASTLEDAALKAIELSTGIKSGPLMKDEVIERIAVREGALLSSTQTHICGLYSGGTLAYECLLMLEDAYDYVESNLSKKHKVKDLQNLAAHTTIDFGEDAFTVGRAHPMIDPTLRNAAFVDALTNENVAVLILDMVLGYGAHMEPQKAFVDSLRKYNEERAAGRHVPVIINIVGSKNDPQNYQKIVKDLEDAGAIIAPSNQAAVKLAIAIVERSKVEGGKQ